MKKVILMLMLIIGLNADSAKCIEAHSRYNKYNELFNVAYDKKDLLVIERNLNVLIINGR
ncbi:MAG: hypothetical protein Q8N78_10385 [Sulfurimonas sp.]|nr:hypothetical protein [Sulfurimonas sp.]